MAQKDQKSGKKAAAKKAAKKERAPAALLYEAAQYGRTKEVKQLLSDGVDPNSTWEDKTPLTAAVATRMPSAEVIKVLLEAGADPNLGKPEYMPLVVLCSMSFEAAEAAELLLKAGADPNCRNTCGGTPLMSSASWGDMDAIRVLLAAGADPNLQDSEGKTALNHAMDDFNDEAGELLREVTEQIEYSDKPWRSDQARFSDEERLVLAAEGGDLEYVQTLLSKGVDVNFCNNSDTTALHSASESGHLEVVEFLLQHEADIEARDSVGATALMSAAFGGNTNIAKRLLNAGADIKATDNTGSNVLHRCVSDDNVELVRTLIEAGADVNLKNKTYQFTPLHTAVENAWRSGHDKTPEIVELLVKAGADLGANRTKKDKLTPLHRGIRDLPTIKKMLELGADPNQADGKGTTSLMYAAELSVEHAKALLQAGADPELEDKEGKTAIVYATEAGKDDVAAFLRSQTPGGGDAERPWRSRKAKLKPEARLTEAAKGGDLEYVKELLDSGLAANPPALHAAAEAGQLDVVNFLMANKADLNGRDGTDRTPLIAACMGDSTPVALHLLSLKPVIKAQDIEGNTALHYCARNGNVELIKALMDAGADVDQRCKYYKNTPMHMALLYGKPAQSAAVVKALNDAGANVNLNNGDDAAPLHIAACHPDLETVKLLVEAGAAINEPDANGSTAEESARKWGTPEVAAYLQSLEKV